MSNCWIFSLNKSLKLERIFALSTVGTKTRLRWHPIDRLRLPPELQPFHLYQNPRILGMDRYDTCRLSQRQSFGWHFSLSCSILLVGYLDETFCCCFIVTIIIIIITTRYDLRNQCIQKIVCFQEQPLALGRDVWFAMTGQTLHHKFCIAQDFYPWRW